MVFIYLPIYIKNDDVDPEMTSQENTRNAQTQTLKVN